MSSETKSEGAPKSKQCLACESAMTTFRSQFGCSGLREPDWTPADTMEMTACPWITKCDFFKDNKKVTCEGLKESFSNDFVNTHKILLQKRTAQDDAAASGEKSGDTPPQVYVGNTAKYVYEACAEMSHCPDNEDCRKAILGDTCRDNPSCVEANEICEEGCFVCYWVLRGWFPLFEVPSAESNGKDGYANCQELSASFLELEEQPVRGLGSPSLVKSREKATYKDCLKVWNTIESDPKARYLAQFVSQLGSYEWNANTACRCIGMCGYDTYEAFDLFRACDYEPSDARVASLFPDLLIESDGESGAKF